MIVRVLGVSLIGLTLAGCVNDSSLSGDVYSASEAKQVQSVTYGTVVNARPVQIQVAMTTMLWAQSAVLFWVVSGIPLLAAVQAVLHDPLRRCGGWRCRPGRSGCK